MIQSDKKQKIQWDEETIAEHDKERGSRQKIDEAPTPFRYQSESDQSECESDGERLAREDLEAINDETAAKTSPVPSQATKKKTSLTNPNNVCDSWEAINAKLQYEKHLQDNGGGNSPANTLNLGKPNDSLLRSQFYQSGGSNSNNNFNNPQPPSQNGSPRVSMASGGKIQDLQSNFGEILNPAPAAFSPQFTNKNFRRAGGKPSILVTGSTSADDEGGPRAGEAGAEAGSSGSASWKRKPLLSPEKPHKSVFIKAFGEDGGAVPVGEGGESMGVSPSHSADAAHLEGHGVGLGASADGEDPPSGEKKQFLNKRAGHYNEFKVLQAMRAKLAAEEEEEDETDA